jgi:hypothetical protein
VHLYSSLAAQKVSTLNFYVCRGRRGGLVVSNVRLAPRTVSFVSHADSRE